MSRLETLVRSVLPHRRKMKMRSCMYKEERGCLAVPLPLPVGMCSGCASVRFIQERGHGPSVSTNDTTALGYLAAVDDAGAEYEFRG